MIHSDHFFIWACIIIMLISFTVVDNIHRYWFRRINKKIKCLEETMHGAEHLIDVEAHRREAHTKAFEELTNPNVIVEDFETSAQKVEMLNAKRKRQIRPDGGPPAKIHRMRDLRKGPLK
jgi:hypothetical protein